MKQITLASAGFEKHSKTTKRGVFLSEMDRVVPWALLCSLIQPVYPKGDQGRPPVGVERMLRIYFLQAWFNLSDPAVEEALYDIEAMRRCRYRPRAGSRPGRDHGVQVPTSAGAPRTRRGDLCDGECPPESQRPATVDRDPR